MRVGTPIYILIRNKFKTPGDTQPEFVKVPGIVMSDPVPASYVNRNTGATVQSQNVEVISLRDTTGQNPSGGRRWYQQTNEPVNLLVRRFDAVTGLDTDDAGARMTARDLYARVEQSILDFRMRQAATQPASTLNLDAEDEQLIAAPTQQELVLAAAQ